MDAVAADAASRAAALVTLALAEYETYYIVNGDNASLSLTNCMVCMLAHPQRTRVSALVMPYFTALQTVPTRKRCAVMRERLSLIVFHVLILQLTSAGLAPYWILCQVRHRGFT